MGNQAPLDYKESILSTGENIEVNIFVLLLSFSRYRMYKLSFTKTQVFKEENIVDQAKEKDIPRFL